MINLIVRVNDEHIQEALTLNGERIILTESDKPGLEHRVQQKAKLLEFFYLSPLVRFESEYEKQNKQFEQTASKLQYA